MAGSGTTLTRGFDVLRLTFAVLAPAAIFYAVGYLIIHAFVLETKLQASIWFTETFYREAGAAFFIDVLLAAALLPHVFILWGALLLGFYPGRPVPGSLVGLSLARLEFGLWLDAVIRRRIFYGLLAIGVVLTGYLLHRCGDGDCWQPSATLLAGTWLFGKVRMQEITDARALLASTAAFFAVSIPTMVALGAITLRSLVTDINDAPADSPPAEQTDAARHLVHPFMTLILASSFAVLVVLVPYSYGLLFHDYHLPELSDRQLCLSAEADKQERRVDATKKDEVPIYLIEGTINQQNASPVEKSKDRVSPSVNLGKIEQKEAPPAVMPTDQGQVSYVIHGTIQPPLPLGEKRPAGQSKPQNVTIVGTISPQLRKVSIDCYLLGEFNKRYVLIGRELASNEQEARTAQRIYVKQVDRLEPFSVLALQVRSLRELVPIEAQPREQ